MTVSIRQSICALALTRTSVHSQSGSLSLAVGNMAITIEKAHSPTFYTESCRTWGPILSSVFNSKGCRVSQVISPEKNDHGHFYLRRVREASRKRMTQCGIST